MVDSQLYPDPSDGTGVGVFGIAGQATRELKRFRVMAPLPCTKPFSRFCFSRMWRGSAAIFLA